MVINQGENGCIYNVGGHNERQNIQIVKIIIRTIHDLMLAEPKFRTLLKSRNAMPRATSALTGLTRT